MSNIEILEEMGYKVHVAANFQYGSTTSQERVEFFKNELMSMGVIVHDIEISRNAFSLKNLKAYIEIKALFDKEEYSLIHCHSPIGGVITRLAARKIRNKGTKIIYTAHGFHFFKGAPLKNWVVFYPIERWLARYTDVLITINKEDYKRAKKTFKAGRVEYIPGVGIDTKKLSEVDVNKLTKRKELGVPNDAFLVLSVGELNKNKNHETIIKAISKLNNQNVYYIICGQGPLHDYLRNIIRKLGLDNHVRLLGFRNDIAEICKVSDAFAFPSYREGLPVALMEAMTCGLPVVCSDIRGNIDLIQHKIGGYIVKSNDVECFARSIEKLFDRGKEMGMANIEFIKGFDVKIVIGKMKEIYKSVSNEEV